MPSRRRTSRARTDPGARTVKTVFVCLLVSYLSSADYTAHDDQVNDRKGQEKCFLHSASV